MTTLCECGCGQPAPIAKANHRAKGHVKGQPARFVNGHNSRGLTRSSETRAKIAAAKLGNKNGVGPRAVRDDVKPSTVHSWLNRWHPKQGCCEECGASGVTDYAFLHHPAAYTRVRSDYRELCRRCHMQLDIDHGIRPDWGQWLSRPPKEET